MGIADIPTKFGPDLLIRTVLPGLIAFIIFFEPVIYPLIHNFWDALGSFEDKLLVLLLGGFAIGLIFMFCDLYVYQLLEGLRFWPEFLWKWKYERMQRYFQNLDEELKNLIRQKREESAELSPTELERLSLKISKLSAKVREFPPDFDKRNFTKRYPKRPTRFGNVLHEYENYSENRYGIHMMVFGNHLSQILSPETKKELELGSAIADLCVYLCFISLLYVFLGPVALLFQKSSWIAVSNRMIPARSFLYLLFSILVFRFLYELSITRHKRYGRFVKSIFDIYRKDLADKLGIEINGTHYTSRKELEEEKALWKQYQDYYLDYKFLKKKSKREKVSRKKH